MRILQASAVIVLLAASCITSVAAIDEAPFPEPASKKGLQVQMVDDALALGVKHAALNVNFAQLLAVTPATNDLPEHFDGREFSFRKAYVEHLDRQIKALSDHQVIVSLIL